MKNPNFRFGANWKAYSENALDQERLSQSRAHFLNLLPVYKLTGKTFLDVGFGQGLALCFAQEAGAAAYGIDIDSDNIEALNATLSFFPGMRRPSFEIGSILNPTLVQKYLSCGGYDIVYSWGVLHHTGDMWQAIENAAQLVKKEGILMISIYKNHWTSPIWRTIKRMYNISPRIFQQILVFLLVPVIYFAKFLATFENPLVKERGMSFYYDVVDWVGGYPYEYADPDSIVLFLDKLGFECVFVLPDKVPTGIIEYKFIRK